MEDKYNVEQYLDKYMPKTNVQIYEKFEDKDKHVSEAPSVKGYFKLISLRYMKRVKDIKDLCVDYINTYIDGSLNVAEKMDDVKLVETRDGLAKDIKFELEGFSTSGNAKGAQTKAGVAFLIGDKALKDKLNAILAKIDLRATKSPILKNWADLMVLQSKVIATNKLYELTNEMIKGEAKQSKEKVKEIQQENENESAKVQESQKETQQELTKDIEQFGDRDSWFDKKEITTKEIIDKYNINNIKKTDFENISDENNKIKKSREEFYGNKYKEQFDKIEAEVNKIENLNDADKQYLIACTAVENTDGGKKFVASPIDVAIAMSNRNTETIKTLFKDHENDVADINKNFYKIDLSNNVQKSFDTLIKDKNFDNNLWYVYSTMFANDTQKTNESLHILTPIQFITEQLFNTYMDLKDMELTMMDILDDCEDGCLYVGNFPAIKEDEVDYVMLDGNGGFGFYKENGNLDMALAMGEPQDISLVEFNDGKKKALLSTIIDFISDDVFGKLK